MPENFITANGEGEAEEGASRTWTVTNRLRWKTHRRPEIIGQDKNIRVLEQMWQGDRGHQRWESVEFVD